MVRKPWLLTMGALALVVSACAPTDEAGQEVSTGDPVEEVAPDPDPGAGVGEGMAEATPQFMSQAAEQTAAVETGRFSMSMQVVGSAELPGDPVLYRAEGAFAGPDRSYLSMDLSGMADVAEASGELGSEGMGGMGGMLFTEPFEVVVDGDTTYMKWPFFSGALGASTPWVSTPSGADAAGLGDVSMDPSDVLDLMQGAGDVTEVGTEVVDGTESVRYSVALDLDALGESLGDDELSGLGVLPAGAATIDVWIGDDGLVRRIVMEVDGSALAGLVPEGSGPTASAPVGTFLMTVDLFDLGADVEIPVPDPSEVSDADALTGFFGGESAPDLFGTETTITMPG
jgi:hypothetical protein